MRAIDLHAHLTPQCFQREVLAGKTWHGMTSAEGELFNPMHCWEYPPAFLLTGVIVGVPGGPRPGPAS